MQQFVTHWLKPGFHSNAIACGALRALRALRKRKPQETQRTQRKRLRLNGNRAWLSDWRRSGWVGARETYLTWSGWRRREGKAKIWSVRECVTWRSIWRWRQSTRNSCKVYSLSTLCVHPSHQSIEVRFSKQVFRNIDSPLKPSGMHQHHTVFILQTHHACPHLVSVHQTAPPLTDCSSVYQCCTRFASTVVEKCTGIVNLSKNI